MLEFDSEIKSGKRQAALTELGFIIILLVFASLFIYFWLSYFGNGIQIYNDVVCEVTSQWSSNKSPERNLVYVLGLIGCFAIIVFYLIKNKNWKEEVSDSIGEGKSNVSVKIYVTALLTAAIVHYIVYSGYNSMLIMMMLLLAIMHVADKKHTVDGLLFFISFIYAACGIYRLYIFLGGDKAIDITMIVFLGSVASMVMLAIAKKRKMELFAKGFLILQTCLPFSLLIFLANKYKYEGEVVRLALPKQITYVIWAVIVWLVLLAFHKLKKNWNKLSDIDESISFGTLCCIMNFNNYSGTGQIISADLHHPFENIIGFSQIAELGQKPFEEYIPVSGLYSFFHGFFLYLFGNSYYSYYYVTENLFYFTITIIIIWLARKQMDNFIVLLIAFMVPVMRYNRVALILPIMLLLTWSKLADNKNLWLKAWMLSSLVHGLYYPVFGAAVCLGFLPLAVYQFVTYWKRTLKTDFKKRNFWVAWGCSILPVLLCIPLLLGTLKHMKAMGGQTVYADGISRFGQTLPDNFISYVPVFGLRLFSYDVLTFLIQVSVVWVSAILTMKFGGVVLKDGKIQWDNGKKAAVCMSFGIALMVSFSYTLIRLDINSIYARSAGVIYASAVMLIIIGVRYLKNSRMLYILVGFATFLVSMASQESFYKIADSNKLDPYYTVAEDNVLVEDEHVPRLGKCFVQQSIYENIINNYDTIHSSDSEIGYLGIGQFGNYYLSERKGNSVMETVTIKGYDAAQETVDLIRKHDTIIGPIDAFASYYLYHWLVTSGEYIWSAEDGKWYPNSENIQTKNTILGVLGEGASLGRTPASWGSSMESLEKIFTPLSTEVGIVDFGSYVTIQMGEKIDGDEADYLYLDFDGVEQNYDYILMNHEEEVIQTDLSNFNRTLMKKDYNRGINVTLVWNDDAGNQHSLICALGRGKILVPLGSGAGWLLNAHDYVAIVVTKDGEIVQVPQLADVRLLKLREVK